MPHPGPSTIRTPRTRALEIGTNPAGFDGQVDYDSHAGVPASDIPGAGGQHYKEQPPYVGGSGEPVGQPSPIK